MKHYLTGFLLLLLFLCSIASVSNAESTRIPDTVKIGSYIISLHDLEFKDKEYTARFWLWMHYKNPNFDFTSQVEVPNAKSMEKSETFVDTIQGITWVLMKMKCTMKQSWEITDYPFDDQALRIRVENTMYDARSLVFKPDTLQSGYDSAIVIDGWDITGFKLSSGINPYQTSFGDPRLKEAHSEYASFNIDIKLERNAWGLFLKIFLGMYIAFFIAVISFIIQPHNVDPRFGLPVGGLFAAVGNKYIIDAFLPENLSFTLVDLLHAITFLFIFFTIAVSAVSLILLNKGNPKKARQFDKVGALVVVVVYLIINITLVTLAILH